jgi:hypothetical protein
MKQQSSAVRIKIIGLPTAKVRHAVNNANASLSHFESRPKIQWISDIQRIASMGALVVPTVFVNDKLKCAGRIPSVYEFETWVEEERQTQVVLSKEPEFYSH